MSIEILSGNELIIQGGLEAGFSLYTGYPGSPLADYFNILYQKKDELKSKGIQVVIANSEANAAAMASGAKQAGRDCLIAMKSMGLHVAADALSVGNFANPGNETKDAVTGDTVKPGTVVVVGDDPWSISTSTAADSRYLFKHLHIPFLEPSTPQELKDWIAHALYISRRSSVYHGLLLTTFMAEGGGRVEIGSEVKVDGELHTINTEEFDLQKLVMVPPNSLNADVAMIKERFPKVEGLLASLKLDQTYGKAGSKIGVISSGVIFETLKQVMEEGGHLESMSLYKLASSYPLAEDLLLPWLKKIDKLIVVEEKRGFLESQIIEFINKHGLSIETVGKNFGKNEGFPAYGGLNFEIISKKMEEALLFLKVNPCKDLTFPVLSWENPLPRRLPTFCPGCPHRETLSLLKDLRASLKEKGVDLLSHGDVGCYSLSFLPPFKEMHNLSAMGQGGALGAGVDIFSNNPSVVLMGDSTFYHSGITDISNSVQMGHTITYILLDNDNTAMTGHQVTPSTGINVRGDVRPEQDMLAAVRALGVAEAIEVNPSDRYYYKNILHETVEKPGVKVIISNKECALTFHGRRKSEERKLLKENGYLKKQSFYQINTSVCEDCRECVDMTGCPGLSQTFDAYGTKVTIDPQICVADSYCTKIKACPSFELVEVLDYHPTRYRNHDEREISLESLPAPTPKKNFDAIASGKDLRIVVTGVGGSGVTTISRVLAEAAREMDGRSDLDFKFVDQKGLAQRNGNVTAHLCIYKKGKSYGAITPKGTADLLISPDLLDGANHINFLAEQGQMLLDEDFQIPLSILLDKGEEETPIDKETLHKKLENKIGERVSFYPTKNLAYHALGRSVYSSTILLGIAFQKGLFPFSLTNMTDALKRTVTDHENNLKAFHLGRKMVLEDIQEILRAYRPYRKDSRIMQIKDSLLDSLLPWHPKKVILNSFESNLEKLISWFPEIKKDYLARYIHDILIYDRGLKMDRFLVDAATVANLYRNTELKKLALRTLVRTYWIKDEVFVSHLMISKFQKRIDSSRYKQIGKKYKVTHINRPSFDVFGMKVEFDINPRDWMLRIMRHMRLLRYFLPGWHNKEKDLALKIRAEVLDKIPRLPEEAQRKRLVQVENIKGYREIRYKKAAEVFEE